MKRLLLILATIAYIAISCEDKPTTLTGGDEPEVDTSADTCKIYFECLDAPVAMFYQTSSDSVDFLASTYSIFKHFTITLKDGSLPTAIGHNCIFDRGSTFDTGNCSSRYYDILIDSLKYGHYIAILWDYAINWQDDFSWGQNHENEYLKCLYKDIVLDKFHTTDSIILTQREFSELIKSAPTLTFTEF